jgi:FkbM family methyltransferase
MSSGKTQRYRIGSLEIELPAEHLLPEYQAAHPRYDRLLPHLAAQLAPGVVVIDIGANCGDSLAALWSGQSALEVICIEADPGFFALLERNTRQMCSDGANLHLVQALVGQALTQATLQGGGGTRQAQAAPEGQGLAAQRLDDIVAALPRNVSAGVRLVKCDVDGWDYDVIDSAPLLCRQLPMLFFECQIDTAAQREAYLHTLQGLFDAGYAQALVFDNFGNLMTRCDALPALQALIDYVWHQSRGTRTVHYLDLLFCSAADVALAERAVAAFLA